MVILQALIAGLLAFGSFAPLALWWLAPFSLLILIRILSERPLRARFTLVFIYGLGFFAPLLSWTNTYVGDTPWALLVILESTLLFPIALIPFSRRKPFTYLLLPSVLVLTEAISSRFPFGGFGWGRLAFSQADAPYSQVAQWGGAPALSFIVATVAILLYFTLRRNSSIAVLIFGVLASTIFLTRTPGEIPSHNINILAIQGGVPSYGLHFNERARAVFTMHVKATQRYLSQATRAPDVIFWPENAVDIDPLRDPIVNNDLRNLVDASNIPMVLGAVLENERSFSNASILWQPKIGPTSIYRKMHLTPFGEYIPLRTLAEHISTYAKGVTDFLPGDVHVIHSVAGAKIAPIICYELIDDSLGRQLSASSNLLLVQTNSATFGTTSESRQQLGIARIRAIEHQRYLVSVSTTGISAIVDPKGRVRQQTHLGEIGALQAFVELLDRRSFSDRYGGQGEILLMVLPPVLIALGWLFRGKRKKLGVPQ